MKKRWKKTIVFVGVLITLACFTAVTGTAAFAFSGNGTHHMKDYKKLKHARLFKKKIEEAWKAFIAQKRNNPTVWTWNGKIRGKVDELNTWTWQGIPYAKPPVDELRWKAPVDPERWHGIKETTELCSACPQYYDGPILGSEDCLYLNVWRPQTFQRHLPVYFWIHGGGNSIGTASVPSFNGSKLAADANMVVVTINYRIGPLGWFSHPSLRHGEDAFDDSGNYGTLDIIKALQWVHENIAFFGGDPDNVTIDGESAGGVDVYTMILSPAAAGLFHKAIAQSGGTPSVTVEAADASASAAIAKILQADGLTEPPGGDLEAYLKSKTIYEILGVYQTGAGNMLNDEFVSNFLDGAVIREEGVYAMADPEKYNQVPMIVGSNKEEYKLFIASAYYGVVPDDVYQSMALTYSNQWKIAAVDTPATLMAAHATQPEIFAYQLHYGAYNIDGYNAWPTDLYGINFALMLGCAHGLDVPIFWGNYYYFGYDDIIFREDNRAGYEALTDAWIAYLASFVRTGAPGDAGGAFWNSWQSDGGIPKRMILDANNTDAILTMSNE